MIDFESISLTTFLNEYWQKKPLVIRNAMPHFNSPLSPDELAGLALEEEIESRLVFETPDKKPFWHLKRGPFTEKDFQVLPETHWTLLVQGVDRLIPQVNALLDHFNFIPQWRIDDVMISYAALHGSVGPHYDNYDVFLYQAKGRREWLLTTQGCTPENYLSDLELRIMDKFIVEERYILEEGDMLYLPPHVGHHGISLSPECMTYSFGYRSYMGQELLDSLADYVSEKEQFNLLYSDPNWSTQYDSAEITPAAWQNAQKLLQKLIQDETIMKSWFGCFVTTLDQQAEQQLPIPLDEEEWMDLPHFIQTLHDNQPSFIRDYSCRFAYTTEPKYQFYINGTEWDVEGVDSKLLQYLANHRHFSFESIRGYLNTAQNQIFLYNLWKLQWLQIG